MTGEKMLEIRREWASVNDREAGAVAGLRPFGDREEGSSRSLGDDEEDEEASGGVDGTHGSDAKRATGGALGEERTAEERLRRIGREPAQEAMERDDLTEAEEEEGEAGRRGERSGVVIVERVYKWRVKTEQSGARRKASEATAKRRSKVGQARRGIGGRVEGIEGKKT